MKIRYVGKRPNYRISFVRQHYNFNIENNRTIDINDQRLIDYIFNLDNHFEFKIVNEAAPHQEKTPVIVKDYEEDEVKEIKKKPGRPKKGGKK